MAKYRCTTSRQIADAHFYAGMEYELSPELVQRYASYFEAVSVASTEPIAVSEYDEQYSEPNTETVPVKSPPMASKRARKS